MSCDGFDYLEYRPACFNYSKYRPACNPMFHDMTSGTQFGEMNIFYNEMAERGRAQFMTYSNPTWNTVFEYSSPVGAPCYMLDPCVVQHQFNMAPTWQHGGSSASGSSSSGKKTDEEKEAEETAKKQNKKLECLIEKYKSLYPSSFDDKISTKYDTAKKEKDATKKSELLEEVYKQLDKTKVKASLLRMTKSELKNAGVTSWSEDLIASGYQYSSKNPDDKISTNVGSIKTAIDSKQIGDINLKISDALNDNDILQILSYWNTNNKNTNLYDKIDKLHVADADKPTKEALLANLREKLVNKAESVLDDDDECIDAQMKSNIQSLKTTVNNKNCSAVDFYKLYYCLRYAEAQRISNSVNNYYSFINDIDNKDTDFLSANMVLIDTLKDLKEEGLGEYLTNQADKALKYFEKKAEETKGSEKAEEEEEEVEESSETPSDETTSDETPSDETPSGPVVDMTEDSSDSSSGSRISRSGFNAKSAGQDARTTLCDITSDEDAIDIDNSLKNLDKTNVLDFLDGYYDDGDDFNWVEGLIEHLDDDGGANISMESKMNLLNSTLDKAEELGLTTSTHYKKIADILGKGCYSSDSNRTDFNKKTYGFWKDTGHHLKQTIIGGIGSVASGIGAGVGVAALASGPWGWAAGIATGLGGLIWTACDRTTDNEILDEHLEGLYKEMRKEVNRRKAAKATK